MDVINKCCPPKQEFWEYELPKSVLPINTKIDISIPKTNICKLKAKVWEEFYKVICKLQKGVLPSLELILEEISVIQLEAKLDKREFIIQHYLYEQA